MNNSFPKRFRNVVSLREHFEEIIALRFKAIEEQIIEARRLMEKTMDGFPALFLRKGELGEEITGLKSEVKTLTEFKNKAEGMASRQSVDSVRWIALAGLSVGVLGAVIALLAFLLKLQ